MVISVPLVFILLANAVIGLFQQLPRLVTYVGLFGTLAASYLIPANPLFHESWLVHGLLATGLYCAPVFFARVVFISSFRRAGFRAEAFGSNLLGALAGGLLESLSYVVGIQALVLLAGGLYLMSLLTAGRGLAGEMADDGGDAPVPA